MIHQAPSMLAAIVGLLAQQPANMTFTVELLDVTILTEELTAAVRGDDEVGAILAHNILMRVMTPGWETELYGIALGNVAHGGYIIVQTDAVGKESLIHYVEA